MPSLGEGRQSQLGHELHLEQEHSGHLQTNVDLSQQVNSMGQPLPLHSGSHQLHPLHQPVHTLNHPIHPLNQPGHNLNQPGHPLNPGQTIIHGGHTNIGPAGPGLGGPQLRMNQVGVNSPVHIALKQPEGWRDAPYTTPPANQTLYTPNHASPANQTMFTSNNAPLAHRTVYTHDHAPSANQVVSEEENIMDFLKDLESFGELRVKEIFSFYDYDTRNFSQTVQQTNLQFACIFFV